MTGRRRNVYPWEYSPKIQKVTIRDPEPAWRVVDGVNHPGQYIFIELVLYQGVLRFTYEFTFYHWDESDTWDADVISPYGWYDLTEDECQSAVEHFSLEDRLASPHMTS